MENINVNHTWVTDNVLYVTYYFFIGNKVSWPTAGIENGSAGLIQEKLHDRITLNCQYSMLQTWSCILNKWFDFVRKYSLQTVRQICLPGTLYLVVTIKTRITRCHILYVTIATVQLQEVHPPVSKCLGVSLHEEFAAWKSPASLCSKVLIDTKLQAFTVNL